MDGVRVVLIAGPTASGKSRAALALAERLGGSVINADSMQVYEDLRILTARPDDEEVARVPHRLYGTVAGSVAYNVGLWCSDVARAIAEEEAQGRLPIIIGGTGLYFKALLEGLSPIPDIPSDIRDHWRQAARQADPATLHDLLRARDPIMAERLRPSDPQRIVRALEVWDATGRSLAAWQEEQGTGILAPADCLKFVLAPERQTLHEKIDRRFDIMVESGAITEVERLLEQGLQPDLPIMRAHGVRPIGGFLRNDWSLEEAADQTKAETRQYAKRQFTWLRRNMIAWNWVEEKEMERFVANIFSFIDH